MERKYLQSKEVVEVWNLYNKGYTGDQIGRQLNISGTTALLWVSDLKKALGGQKVERRKGLAALEQAVFQIKQDSATSVARKKLLNAIDEYVDAEVKDRIRKMNQMLG